MRLVVSTPRKSGGAHLRCLLAMAYDLKAPPAFAPATREVAAITRWIADLPEQSVSTCDLPYAALGAPAAVAGVQVIGVIRHPFDLFVSNYDVAQQRATRGREDNEADHPWSILSGEDLDGDIAQDYAASSFASDVAALRDWSAAGVSVRYEDLLADPEAVLHALSLTVGPRTDEQISRAISLCPAENVVASRPGRGRRMPSLPPGAWRERLPRTLLDTLRTRYGADVDALGYDAS